MVFCSLGLFGNALFAATDTKIQSNTSLIYPLKQVSTFKCRQLIKPWSELDNSCKVSLPIIQKAHYADYRSDTEYTNIYTTLWWATYNDGWDNDKGDHAGVDIASAKWTPLYAVAHGIVTFAGTQAGYGNVVKIMFVYKWVTYHAVYGHMNSIAVNKGEIVEQGQQIGEVGNSGSTFWALGWYHVHFEIDKDNGWRPAYYYQWCEALKDHSLTQITNGWLCRAYREQYSYDPIVFIEQARGGHSIDVALVIPSVHPAAPEKPVSQLSLQKLTTTFLPLKKIQSHKLSHEAIDFLQNQDVQLVAYTNTKMNLWQTGKITLYITKKWSAKKYNGALPIAFSFVASSDSIDLTQQWVQYIAQGVQTISFTTKKLGKSTIVVSIDGQQLASLPVEVIQ